MHKRECLCVLKRVERRLSKDFNYEIEEMIYQNSENSFLSLSAKDVEIFVNRKKSMILKILVNLRKV